MSLFHIYGRYYYRGGQGYSEEYQAVLSQATANGDSVPTSSTQKSKENTFITDLKAADLWDRALYILMLKTVGGDKNYVSLNWVDPTESATVTNAVLVEDGGLMAEDGIDSGFDLANADQDDVTYCSGALLDTGLANRALFGAGDGSDVTSDALFFNPRNTSDQGSYSVSDATITAIANGKLGLARAIIARSAGTKYYSLNGAAFVSASVAHGAITTPKNVYLLAMNGSSVVYKNPYGGSRYWCVFSGKFTDAEAAAFDAAIKKYLAPTNNIPLVFEAFNRASLGTTVWTREGSGATISISSNKLRLVGSSASTDAVRYNQVNTSFEDFTMTAKVTPQSAAGETNYGIAFGIRSNNSSSRRDNCMQLGMLTGNVGKWYFNTGDGAALTAKGNGGGYALEVGTEYNVEVSCSKRTWTARLMDSGGTVLSEFSHATASTEGEVASLGGTNLHGQFAIWSIGGTWDVDDFKVTAPKEYHEAKYVFAGDSITRGSSATSPATRFVSIIADGETEQVVCYATGSNKTAEILTGLNQIIELRPETVFLMIGGNDIFYSVASATYEANYTSIRDRLVAAGINVIHLLATPRTATDVRALNTFIQTDFSGDTIIDTFTPLKGAGDYDLHADYDSGDGVHPNDAGHALLASTILAGI